MDINRGNRFETLTSVATKARGLNKHIVEKGGKDHPKAEVRFKTGDVVLTTLTSARGETVRITHDTSLVRPYSLGFYCQGTDGIWMVDNNSIFLNGISPGEHAWEQFDKYQEKYDSRLWKKHAEDAEAAGHGGIDFFILNLFVESIKRQVQTPIDVYDSAVWSVISPLSEQSVAQGGHPGKS